jgi:hypothetical protein
MLLATGRDESDVGRLFAGFTAWAEPFRSIVAELGGTRGARPEASHATGGPDDQH